jgi:hypothetical protein
MSESEVKRVRREDGMTVTIVSHPGALPNIPSRVCAEFSYHFLPCDEEQCNERGFFHPDRNHRLASVQFPAGSVFRRQADRTVELSKEPELHLVCKLWLAKYNGTLRFEKVWPWRYLCRLWARDHPEFRAALDACILFGRQYLLAPAIKVLDEDFGVEIAGDPDGKFVEV